MFLNTNRHESQVDFGRLTPTLTPTRAQYEVRQVSK